MKPRHHRRNTIRAGWALVPVLFLIVMPWHLVSVSNRTASTPRPAGPCLRGRFPSSTDTIPPNWNGPVFRLSQNYPEARPSPERYPWKGIKSPGAYLIRVRNYLYEGNIEPGYPNAPWVIENNPVRKWYHAPWLHAGKNRREFIHGLTRELASVPGQLWDNPPQSRDIQNWAVGFYNPPGGYILGQVWCDPQNPGITSLKFPEGTVSAKLIFSAAPLSQVPFLRGSVEWIANINTVTEDPLSPRAPRRMRLIQLDLAVRDDDNKYTGWNFGTLIYNPNAPGRNPWAKMQPVGLMWGNDPGVTPSNDRPIVQTWRNRVVEPLMRHYGWAERLNGPVDNMLSSCLSCHATAGWPLVDRVPPPNSTDLQRLYWFQNIRAGDPFQPGQKSFDYSLQLTYGIRAFLESKADMLGLKEVNRTGTTEEIFRHEMLKELERRKRTRRN